jgi:hypothetical protein
LVDVLISLDEFIELPVHAFTEVVPHQLLNVAHGRQPELMKGLAAQQWTHIATALRRPPGRAFICWRGNLQTDCFVQRIEFALSVALKAQ